MSSFRISLTLGKAQKSAPIIEFLAGYISDDTPRCSSSTRAIAAVWRDPHLACSRARLPKTPVSRGLAAICPTAFETCAGSSSRPRSSVHRRAPRCTAACAALRSPVRRAPHCPRRAPPCTAARAALRCEYRLYNCFLYVSITIRVLVLGES